METSSWSSLIWAGFWICVILMFKNSVIMILNALGSIGNKTKIIQGLGFNIDLNETESSSFPPILQRQTNERFFELQKEYQSYIVTVEENSIRSKLIEAKLSQEQAVNILINHLANSRLMLIMNIIDRQIFPEQLYWPQ